MLWAQTDIKDVGRLRLREPAYLYVFVPMLAFVFIGVGSDWCVLVRS